MKNIEGAFGQIGDAVEYKNGILSKTTLKEGCAIHGFRDYAELETVAEQRGHKVVDTTITSSNEWVYSKEQSK